MPSTSMSSITILFARGGTLARILWLVVDSGYQLFKLSFVVRSAVTQKPQETDSRAFFVFSERLDVYTYQEDFCNRICS